MPRASSRGKFDIAGAGRMRYRRSRIILNVHVAQQDRAQDS